MSSVRPRGREAEARRNDERVLEAALAVYARDPKAPMSAVAQRASVGQASLYRRYRSKEELLARVCEDGMERMRAAAVAAAESTADPLDSLETFLRWYLESGTPQLSRLLGTFSPAEPLFTLARETNDAIQALVDRAVAAGQMRADITSADLTLLITQLSALEHGEPARGAALRERYLTLFLQALARVDAPELPATPPDAAEIEGPWRQAR